MVKRFPITKSGKLKIYNPRLTGLPYDGPVRWGFFFRADGMAWPAFAQRLAGRHLSALKTRASNLGRWGMQARRLYPPCHLFSLSLRADMRPFRRHRFEAAG